MKKLFTAVLLGVALAGISYAQTSPAGKAAEVKVAVVEFSVGANAAGMTPEAVRTLQTTLAHAVFKTPRFDVADSRWTRNASQADLAAINGGVSTAAAVKLGKTLGVSYVLAGTVVEYAPKGEDGFGRVTLKAHLIEVATGKIKYSGETTARSARAMYTNGAAEMQATTMKPAIEKLTATLEGVKL